MTKTPELDDAAPDVSVYPDADDPATGRRQLEQLAFKMVSTSRSVVSTESLGHAGTKAAS